MSERNEILDDVLTVVTWFRERPDIPLPGGFRHLQIFAWDTKDEAEKLARAFGTCKKDSDEMFFRLSRRFGAVKVEGVFSREQVCQRVVVGTKEVEEEQADPDALAALPKIKVKKQVEIVEWKCPELLGEARDKPEEGKAR